MLVICERADPEGRGRRQATVLDVEVEHRDRLRKRRAPSVAYEPFRRLRLRCGDEIHKTALVRLREGFDEVLVDGMHLQVLSGQPLIVQGTSFERLYDLHLLHYVLDEGPEIGHWAALASTIFENDSLAAAKEGRKRSVPALPRQVGCRTARGEKWFAVLWACCIPRVRIVRQYTPLDLRLHGALSLRKDEIST